MPNFRDKVVPLVQVGELDEDGLGLKKDDLNLVVNKVRHPHSSRYRGHSYFYRTVRKKFMVVPT